MELLLYQSDIIFNRHGSGPRQRRCCAKSDLMKHIKETERLSKYLVQIRHSHPDPLWAYSHISNCHPHWKYFKKSD